MLIAVATLMLMSCSPEAAEDTAPAPLPVEVVSVGDSAQTSQPRFPATIVRDREAELSFRIGGQVRSIGVRIGDRLERGAFVAALNATPFTSNRIRAQAEVDRLSRAARRYDELVNAGAIAPVQQQDNLSALRAAEAALASARYDETSAQARMPFAGVILSRDVEIGETVAAGQRLVTVADLSSPPIAKVQAPQMIATRLRVGASASLLLPGRSTPIVARVRRVGAASDARTATTEVELTFESQPDIASGAIGSVIFAATDAPKTGDLFPAEVLLDADKGRGAIFIVDRRSVARRVRIGFAGFEGDQVRLVGVAPGAQVITSGAGFVKDGQRVQVSNR